MCQPCVSHVSAMCTYHHLPISYRFAYLPSNSILPPHSSLPLEFPYACALASQTQPPPEQVAMPSTDHGDAAAGRRDAAGALLFERKGASLSNPGPSISVCQSFCDCQGRRCALHKGHLWPRHTCVVCGNKEQDCPPGLHRHPVGLAWPERESTILHQVPPGHIHSGPYRGEPNNDALRLAVRDGDLHRLFLELLEVFPGARRENYFVPGFGRAWRKRRLELDIDICRDYRQRCKKMIEGSITATDHGAGSTATDHGAGTTATDHGAGTATDHGAGSTVRSDHSSKFASSASTTECIVIEDDSIDDGSQRFCEV